MSTEIVLGCRARLASDQHRRNPQTQGTVIEVDRYRDRDKLVRIQFEDRDLGDRRVRWLPKDQLVRFGGDHVTRPENLPVYVHDGDVTHLAASSETTVIR